MESASNPLITLHLTKSDLYPRACFVPLIQSEGILIYLLDFYVAYCSKYNFIFPIYQTEVKIELECPQFLKQKFNLLLHAHIYFFFFLVLVEKCPEENLQMKKW